MDYNKPIESLEQAKLFFISMGCSGFHMSREYPQRYKEYKKLNISRETEKIWKQEDLDNLYNIIMEKGLSDVMVSSYLTLVEDLGTGDNIIKAYDVVKKYYKSLSPLYMVILAEQLFGSGASYPCGCILTAHKLGLFELENKFKKAAYKMVKIAIKLDNSLKNRGECAIAPRVYDQKLIDTLEKFNLLCRLEEMTKNDSSTN